MKVLPIIINDRYLSSVLRKSHAVVFLAFTISGCYHFSGTATSGDVISENNLQKTVVLDSGFSNYLGLNNSTAVHRFYISRGFEPVWIKGKQPTAPADSLYRFIQSSRHYGLLRHHYHWSEIENAFKHSVFESDSIVQRLDMILTDAFLSAAKHLKYGRLSMIETSASDSLAMSALRVALTQNRVKKTLELLQPEHHQYIMLRSSLVNIISSCDSAERASIMSGKTVLESEHAAKIMKLEINMDRWRTESAWGDRFVHVNIPGYYLEIIEGDTLSFESGIIVGTAKDQTPVLDGVIRSFVIFPYWNVPRGIAVNEILPQIKRDSTYLASHHYEILDKAGSVLEPDSINWSLYHKNNFPFTIRQKEGLHNALGLIKFWFSNPYAVYLHDTNARLMFNRKKRALSHGCVRLERALELGRYLVRDNDMCSPEDLDQYLEMKQQLSIKVVNPIPLHIRYFTSAHRNGEVEFYDDVYGEDEKVRELLYLNPLNTNLIAMDEAKSI